MAEVEMNKAFLEALKAYRDPQYNLLGDHMTPANPSGNALLYESHAARIYKDLVSNYILNSNYVTDGFCCHPEFYDAVKLLQVTPGLLRRKPLPSQDEESHDDYVGVSSVSPTNAMYIALRGRIRGWLYDTWRPNATFCKAIKWIVCRYKPISYLKFWHGRMPGLTASYKVGTGTLKVRPWTWAVWSLSIMWTVRKAGNESGWLLDYLKLRAGLEHYPKNTAVKVTAWWYKKQITKHYQGNIKGVYAIYFVPGHPFALYSDWPRA